MHVQLLEVHILLDLHQQRCDDVHCLAKIHQVQLRVLLVLKLEPKHFCASRINPNNKRRQTADELIHGVREFPGRGGPVLELVLEDANELVDVVDDALLAKVDVCHQASLEHFANDCGLPHVLKMK